jgi:hypothetical protein
MPYVTSLFSIENPQSVNRKAHESFFIYKWREGFLCANATVPTSTCACALATFVVIDSLSGQIFAYAQSRRNTRPFNV